MQLKRGVIRRSRKHPMSTDNPSFSWGADTFERGAGKSPRAKGRARGQSLLGARMAAVLIDGLVLLIPAFAIAYLLSLAFPHHGFFITRSSTGTAHYVLQAPGLFLITALSLGYFFVCESLWEQTVGKRAMGLRVRSASGAPAGLNAISARTVLRLIDGLGLYLVGYLVALLTGPRRRRIGDWAGSTVVVRDDGAFVQPRRDLWRVALYPAGWLIAVLVAIFALGLGTAAGEGEAAIALVRSYVQARQQGNAVLACSMLTTGQQREIVAIEGRSYRGATAGRCPDFILRSEPDSHLLNPGLVQLSESGLSASYSRLGAAVVYSPQDPGLRLIALSEGGHMKLDMRGFEKLDFVRGCADAGRLTADECACAFDLARTEGPFPDHGLTLSEARVLEADARRCAGVSRIPSQ